MAQLYFRYGTMSSGKSAELLRVAHNYEEQGKSVMLYTSPKDDRSGTGNISSRIGLERSAHTVSQNIIEEVAYHMPNCVLADEGQFYSEQDVDNLAYIVTQYGVPVICYGLKVDFSGNLFPGSKRLIELAHKIEEIKTMCWYTDDKATMNVRMSDGEPVFEGNQVEVGGNEMYVPVCLKCYMKMKGAR